MDVLVIEVLWSSELLGVVFKCEYTSIFHAVIIYFRMILCSNSCGSSPWTGTVFWVYRSEVWKTVTFSSVLQFRPSDDKLNMFSVCLFGKSPSYIPSAAAARLSNKVISTVGGKIRTEVIEILPKHSDHTIL